MSIKQEGEQKESFQPPTEAEIANAREVFAGHNEVFIKNITVDPYNPKTQNLEKLQESLEYQYSAYDLSFKTGFVVHPDGIIFNGKNYARWDNVPEGCTYAVYARPKGQESTLCTPIESKDKLINFIRLEMVFPLIYDEDGWNETIVNNAREMYGNSWRDKVIHRPHQS